MNKTKKELEELALSLAHEIKALQDKLLDCNKKIEASNILWKPKSGKFVIGITDNEFTLSHHIIPTFSNIGNIRDSQTAAENDISKITKYLRELAYKREFDPNFIESNPNVGYRVYRRDNGAWDMYANTMNRISLCSFSKETAEQLIIKLDANMVKF